MTEKKRKIGERPRSRRSLVIDRLPGAILERICDERRRWKPWIQIERESPAWREWEEVPAKVVLYLHSAQDILRRLRTHPAVREALEPLREELVMELKQGAEQFAARFETPAGEHDIG